MKAKLLGGNSYYNSTIIQDPKYFFGRGDLFKIIYAAILQHQCVSLIGSPRIGKSSLLKYVASPEFQKRYSDELSSVLFILVVLSEHLDKSGDEFYQFISETIVAKCKEQHGLSLTTSKGSDGLRTLLEQLAEHGLFPVLLMDSFDSLKDCKAYDRNFLPFLRAQANGGKISYVNASTLPLIDICREDGVVSPYFNLFTERKIGALTPAEAQLLVRQLAAEAGNPFTEQEIAWILRMGGNYPYLLQRSGYFLLESKKEKKEDVDLNDVQTQVYEAVLSMFQNIWDHAQSEQRARLKEHAKRGDQQMLVLPELSGSLLFSNFVQKKCGIADIALTVADLEDALDHIHDFSYLTESKLKDLSVVQVRLKPHSTPSSLDKVRAIRETLDEALEQLSGHGMRTHRAEDWQIYNVLHFRYFDKRQVKFPAIASRLEVSPRTAYRRREEAIEKLYTALLTMEAEATLERIQEEG